MADNETALRAAYPQVVAEVPGSPVFLVTLCKGARHIEVQVPAQDPGGKRPHTPSILRKGPYSVNALQNALDPP